MFVTTTWSVYVSPGATTFVGSPDLYIYPNDGTTALNVDTNDRLAAALLIITLVVFALTPYRFTQLLLRVGSPDGAERLG